MSCNTGVAHGSLGLIKTCFKYLIFLENINIGHLKISQDYFWPPRFSERNGQYIYYIFVYTFENVLIC